MQVVLVVPGARITGTARRKLVASGLNPSVATFDDIVLGPGGSVTQGRITHGRVCVCVCVCVCRGGGGIRE